jgi:hypothetical protein
MPDDDIGSVVDEAIAEAGGAPVPDVEPEVATEEPAPETEVKSEEPAAEAEPETEPEAETKEDEEPEAEPTEEETLGLSAEQLKAINDNPELSAAYKLMQGGLTKKFQEAAEIRKNAEQAQQIYEYMQANPEQALQEFAKVRGYELRQAATKEAEAKANAEDAATSAVNALAEKYGESLGPESAKLLLPMMEEVAKIAAQNAVAPISESTQSLQEAAEQRAIAASVAEFGADVVSQGLVWDEKVQEAMSQVMDTVVAADGVDLRTYLNSVYEIASSRTNKAQATKREIARLRKAQTEAEPVNAVRPQPSVERQITADMSERDAIALATALAEKEARGG